MRLATACFALILTLVPGLYGQSAPSLSNEDVVKLSSAGLSEALVTDMIDKQGARLASDLSSLIQLKQGGVNERIITAVVKKVPSGEALNSDSVLRLVNAKFSDTFIIDLISRRTASFSADANRIIELKQAGVSDRLLSMMVSQSPGREIPRGTEISARLIDGIDSEINKVGDEFEASLEDPIVLGNDVVVQKGARAKVRLVEAKDSGKFKGRTELTLQLMSIVSEGKTIAIETSDVQQASGSRGARTAKSAAAVGAIGAIIGGIAGGGKGAAIGAAAGAGAGAGAQVLLDPQKVKVPSETVLTFVTSAPARL
jgi:hypothetical protein